jgi:hypothetical protein
MKIGIVMVGFAIAVSTPASAQYNSQSIYSGNSGMSGTGSNSNSHTVSPYTNSHGTTVQGSHATNPNHTQTDNYSTKGNVNPYTGAVGTKTPRY